MRPASLLPLALLLAALIGAPTAARAERFRYQYRPGQVIDVRANLAGASILGPTTGKMMKMQFRMSVKQTQRVRAVSGGVATLDVVETPISGKMMSGGKTEAMKKPPTRYQIRVTERGRFVSRKDLGPANDEEGGSGMDGADALFGLNFPDRDLKPGDTWEDTLSVPSGGVPQKVRGTWKYVGRELFQGRDCAKISTTLTIPTSGGSSGGELNESSKMSASMVTYFDPKEGVEVYSSGFLTLTNKADLTAISPDAGELASVTKINSIQWLVPSQRAAQRPRKL